MCSDVHTISHGIQATEGEGQAAETTTAGDIWACAIDLSQSIDEIDTVAVAFWEASRNGEHFAVEDRSVCRVWSASQTPQRQPSERWSSQRSCPARTASPPRSCSTWKTP